MATTTERKLNIQPNALPATLAMTITWAGGSGSMEIPQGDKLSAKGNVSYSGGVRKGLRFEGDPAAVLESLTFALGGVQLTKSEAGVHLSSPRLDKLNRPIPNTGNNPTVCHTAIVELPSAGATVAYQVQVYMTYLGEAKGYSLSVRAFVRPVNVGGPVVVGNFDGLLVSI